MAFTIPEVNPEPIPGVRIQPSADVSTFGGGPGLEAEGQQLQKIGQDAGEIAAFERIRATQTAIQEGTAKLSAVHTQLLTDPVNGLPAYKGTQAMAGHDKLWAEYQKQANAISATLPREAQGGFRRVALDMGDQFNQHVMAHVSQELDRHDTQTFNSLVSNEIQRASTQYGSNKALNGAYKNVVDATTARAQRLGLDPNETKDLMRNVTTKFHESVISQMVNDPTFYKPAKAYFSAHRDEMDVDSQDRIRQQLDVIPKQRDEAAKKAEEQRYKDGERQAFLDMFDRKMTLSEAQRRFRDDQINKSTYELLESRLKAPDALNMTYINQSDPVSFNEIRQAQLTGSKDPGEIQRMIGKAAAAKELTSDDGKYLMSVNDEKPPSPRDKFIEAQANHIRDWGQKYFATKNIFGVETESRKKEAADDADKMVQDFYNSVDRMKAQGDTITQIRDKIKETAMLQRFPSLGNLESPPDVVIDVKSQVTRLLTPDEHSKLKPRFRIVPTGQDQASSK